MALKGINDQMEGWRLKVRKLVLNNENNYKNRGCQYWESVRYPFDDFPYRHVTRTPHDRVTPRTREVSSKIMAIESVAEFRRDVNAHTRSERWGADKLQQLSKQEDALPCRLGRLRAKMIFLSKSKLLSSDAFLKGVAGVKKQFDQL